MNLVFAHDHVFYEIDNVFYSSSGGLSKTALERYTSVFDKVNIVSRHKKLISSCRELTIASTENVSFDSVPDFNKYDFFIKIKEINRIIEGKIINADAVIARLPSFVGSAAVVMAKKHNKPYLIEVVACPWDALWNHSLKGKLVSPYFWMKTKKLVKSAPYVLYVTEVFLQSRYPSNGKVTACSNVYLPDIDKSVLDKRLFNIKHRNQLPLRLGTVAALNVRHKGQEYVIEAICELKKEGYLFDYYLVGGGDHSYLQSLSNKYGVSDQVKIIGNLSHENVLSFLDNLDIYIQPSNQEGLPRALIEAMSRGCPCLGSSAGGIPELLSKSFIFKKKSIKDISRMLKGFSVDLMTQEAKNNFYQAKVYSKDLLETRRRKFFLDFKCYCSSRAFEEIVAIE